MGKRWLVLDIFAFPENFCIDDEGKGGTAFRTVLPSKKIYCGDAYDDMDHGFMKELIYRFRY